MICDNLSVNEEGHLLFAGYDTVELANKYKTPLYLMDEERIRKNARIYVNAMKKYFGEGSVPSYASKAASFKRICQIVSEEGMGIDLVSCGEICTAISAGLSLENAYFHSNNKTDEDIVYAIEHGIGYFVVDNAEELEAISKIAREKGITQKLLLRLTPGIDTHTYEAVNTGKVDSKFGTAIETGQAMEITRYALSLDNINLAGFHCHIGSQVFDSDVFVRGAQIMLEFIASVKAELGFEAEILDLGGGYGVRYVESDPVIDIDLRIKEVADFVKKTVVKLGINMPKILMEPGRSIVADAGMTLYTVGTVKRISGYKNYVSIDGGMTDNPRFALYRSAYTVELANKMHEKKNFECSVVGRCCESGDIIQEKVKLSDSVKRGDIVAVLTTGAYNYSMASNYNRIPKPPIVMLDKDKDYLAVRRESFEDVMRYDIG